MFANPILTESAGVNRHLFFSTFNYEWDRLKPSVEIKLVIGFRIVDLSSAAVPGRLRRIGSGRSGRIGP